MKKIQSIIWRHPKYPDVWHHVDKTARWFENKFLLFQLKYVLVSSSYQRGKHAQVTFLRKWVPGGMKHTKRLSSEGHGYCICKTLRTIKLFELLKSLLTVICLVIGWCSQLELCQWLPHQEVPWISWHALGTSPHTLTWMPFVYKPI